MAAPETEKVPVSMRGTYDTIVALTDAFARERLNDEYAALCRRLAARLARKRPSPLSRGKPETWAAGILHALGMVNFLFDPSQDPHVPSSEIYSTFGVSENAAGSKSRYIRKELAIYQGEARWSLPSVVDQQPFAWFVRVNGFLVDARRLPREVQVLAHRKGLIPYVPAHRSSGTEGDPDER